MAIIEREFSNNLYKATYLVDDGQDGMRLDNFIREYIAGFSREQVQKKIKCSEIRIIGRSSKCKPNTTVKTKDKVAIVIPKTNHEDEWWQGQKLVLNEVPEIIYQDSDIMVVSKPPYMATHPTGRHLFNCATVYFEKELQQTVHSIHRLDRETSGVLLMGKNPKVATKFMELFADDRIQKCYFFVSACNQSYSAGDLFSVDYRLGQRDKNSLDRVYIEHYPANSSKGKSAETTFKIIHVETKGSRNYALGLAFPKSGRQHQIRVHAMARGLPLLGDKLYLGSFTTFQRFKDGLATEEDHNKMELSRHALHALAMRFDYRGGKQTFMAPLPSDITNWIKAKSSIDESDLASLLEKEVNHYFNSDSR